MLVSAIKDEGKIMAMTVPIST